MRILVTGGAGYIGSHTIVELIAAGHEPVIVDNLCNSSKEVLGRLKTITGVDVPFYLADIRRNTLQCVVPLLPLHASSRLLIP